MLRGESTARAVPWQREVRPEPGARPGTAVTRLAYPHAPGAQPPARSQGQIRDGAPSEVLRAGAGTAEVVSFVPDRRSAVQSGRRATDTADSPPRLEQVYAAELQRLRDRARAEGYAAGHAEGLATASAVVARVEQEAAARLAETQLRWERRTASAVAALTAATAQVDATPPAGGQELHDLLIDATLTLVQDVFDRELVLARRPGLDALRRAMALRPTDGPTVVRLHPDDLARIPESVVAGLPETVRLVGDPDIEPAGAVAETGVCRVDAQLGPALARVKEALRS